MGLRGCGRRGACCPRTCQPTLNWERAVPNIELGMGVGGIPGVHFINKHRNAGKHRAVSSTCVRGVRTIVPTNSTEGPPILATLRGSPPRQDGDTVTVQRFHVASYSVQAGSPKCRNPAPRRSPARIFIFTPKSKENQWKTPLPKRTLSSRMPSPVEFA